MEHIPGLLSVLKKTIVLQEKKKLTFLLICPLSPGGGGAKGLSDVSFYWTALDEVLTLRKRLTQFDA